MSFVAKKAPHFKAQAVMPDMSFKDIDLDSFRGKQYVILFFYPMDFTFVCPSEIIAFDKAYEKFKAKNVQLLACSTDSVYSHFAWKNMPVDEGGIGMVKFPILSDITKSIARDYQVLHEDSVALRGLFLIDKEGLCRHATINDLPLGRNVDEAMRLVDALQFTEKHGEVCPANWHEGEEGMKADAEGVAKYLAQHH
jgi:peroxiredoxin (alkyl hydroperoxide reductase subunit C)